MSHLFLDPSVSLPTFRINSNFLWGQWLSTLPKLFNYLGMLLKIQVPGLPEDQSHQSEEMKA